MAEVPHGWQHLNTSAATGFIQQEWQQHWPWRPCSAAGGGSGEGGDEAAAVKATAAAACKEESARRRLRYLSARRVCKTGLSERACKCLQGKAGSARRVSARRGLQDESARGSLREPSRRRDCKTVSARPSLREEVCETISARQGGAEWAAAAQTGWDSCPASAPASQALGCCGVLPSCWGCAAASPPACRSFQSSCAASLGATASSPAAPTTPCPALPLLHPTPPRPTPTASQQHLEHNTPPSKWAVRDRHDFYSK